MAAKLLKSRRKGADDALGQLILAHHCGQPSYEIIERHDGHLNISGGAQVYFSEYRQWPKQLKQAIALAYGHVLDIGCGAGRACLYLQRRGYTVTGIDASPLAIKVCRARGVKKLRCLKLESIEKLGAGNFDTILMFGNGFGLFGTAQNARRTLRKLHRMTKPQALILVESRDPHYGNGQDYMRRGKIPGKHAAGRTPKHISIRVRFKNFIGPWFKWIVVSPWEMKSLLMGTGWELERVITSAGSPYYAGVLRRV